MTNVILPIQFVGTQRSGSNLLRVILNQFKEISAPHPPHILKTFFPILHLYGDITEPSSFKCLVQDVCEWVNLNPVPWDIKLEWKEIWGACQKLTLIEVLKAIHEKKAKHDQSKFWCCKSMESIHYYKEVEAELSPKYIHIFRDGRDVALSFMKAVVGPKHVYFLARKWSEEQALCLELKSQLPPERFISIRYEDLIHSPQQVVFEICEKLGIQYTEDALDYYRSNESVAAAKSGRMWTNLTSPILSENHDKFQVEFSAEQLMIFERVAGSMLSQLGYLNRHQFKRGDETFTKSEIDAFRQEDEVLRKKVNLEADPDEIERRVPQEKLYQRILSRKLIQA